MEVRQLKRAKDLQGRLFKDHKLQTKQLCQRTLRLLWLRSSFLDSNQTWPITSSSSTTTRWFTPRVTTSLSTILRIELRRPTLALRALKALHPWPSPRTAVHLPWLRKVTSLQSSKFTASMMSASRMKTARRTRRF